MVSWAFRALWANTARMSNFITNWRTYHLRVALADSEVEFSDAETEICDEYTLGPTVP